MYDLKMHLRTHRGEKNEECTFCGMKFTHPATLRKHLKYKHHQNGINGSSIGIGSIGNVAEKPFKCRHCHKRFRWRHSLQTHLQTLHENNGLNRVHKLQQKVVEEINGIKCEENQLEEVKELEFIQFVKGQQRIRMWRNSKGHTFYDCTCNKRKPIKDLKKIIKHVVNGHERKGWNCLQCGREFENRFQLSAHMHVHKNGG